MDNWEDSSVETLGGRMLRRRSQWDSSSRVGSTASCRRAATWFERPLVESNRKRHLALRSRQRIVGPLEHLNSNSETDRSADRSAQKDWTRRVARFGSQFVANFVAQFVSPLLDR